MKKDNRSVVYYPGERAVEETVRGQAEWEFTWQDLTVGVIFSIRKHIL